ncbi:ArsR family transcriptional regulator [Streptomyces sp. NPDC006285]|uniref:ArsR family transcriptional regulator n=1 Tax=Streptomyces sp. NPDC006285 TaxID=3364742 RepID=UPI003684B685
MLHIHFSAADIGRVRVAAEPDPAWELLLSLHALRAPSEHAVFGSWRDQHARSPDPATRHLLALAPPRGYSPDFLTPAGVGDASSLTDAVLGTDRDRIRTELALLAGARRPPTWMRSLADGDLDSLRHLGAALRRYHQQALVRHWGRIRTITMAEQAMRVRDLLEGGVERLLGSIHPGIRWEAPVLKVAYPVRHEIRLEGRGLLLIPSYFCWGNPITLRDPQLPPVLVYPANRGLLPLVPPTASEHLASTGLARLLGRSRAAVLQDIAVSGPTTGGGVAQRLGMSAASASEHAAVLRSTGLISTHRVANTVRHTVTPLGQALLQGHQPAGAQLPTAPPRSVDRVRHAMQRAV